MFRTPASVTPASLTPPTSVTPLTRTASLVRNVFWTVLALVLLLGTALFFRFGSGIVPMVGGAR